MTYTEYLRSLPKAEIERAVKQKSPPIFQNYGLSESAAMRMVRNVRSRIGLSQLNVLIKGTLVDKVHLRVKKKDVSLRFFVERALRRALAE